MTSETPNLHVVKNLNISKTEKDIEKLKTPLRLVWKCCSDAFQIGSTIFRHRGTLSVTEKHFQASLNGVFSFSISCFVLEIFRFFETCKLGSSDVIYSRLVNYIYIVVNIPLKNRQNSFKLCISIAIWVLHPTIPIV